MYKLAHIINPVVVPRANDLFTAQPITLYTMKEARHCAKDEVKVELFSAQFPEDRSFIPDFFTKTPDLDQSVLDVNNNFRLRRKLPLIRDILYRLYHASDADYLIYTNVDIALKPNFYLYVTKMIHAGLDAFSITRRTLPSYFTDLCQITEMYSAKGEAHPGYDCFVFKRSLYPDFVLGNVCIGTALIGRAVLINMICLSRQMMEMKDLYLTFHLGANRAWIEDKFQDYIEHNFYETNKIIYHFQSNGKLKNHSVIEHFLKHNRAEYWMNKRKNRFWDSLKEKSYHYFYKFHGF